MPESLPLSLLNDYLYCPRRAALKVVEGWRSANQHTHRGDLVHEHADLPGYDILQGVTLLRALPVFSETLGLSGKCAIVERHLAAPWCPSNSNSAPPAPTRSGRFRGRQESPLLKGFSVGSLTNTPHVTVLLAHSRKCRKNPLWLNRMSEPQSPREQSRGAD